MSSWEIIEPEGTTNLVTNPSFETGTTGWATGGTNTIAQSSEQSNFGLYSLKSTYQDSTSLAYYAITLTATAHSLSAWVYVPSDYDGAALRVEFNGFTGATGTRNVYLDMTKIDQWQKAEVPNYTPAAGDLAGYLLLRTDGAPTVGKYVYLDAVQCEALGHVTTYCDGDQEGCEWNGTEHASTSTRSAQSLAGGRLQDFEDDLHFEIGGMIGAGAAPQTVNVDEFAIIPGGEFNSRKVHPRVFTLTGQIRGTSQADVHGKADDLHELLELLSYAGQQPLTTRYTGGPVDKEIRAYYEGGMEGDVRADGPCFWQKHAIRFLACNPYFYGVGEASQLLDHNDSATFRTAAARLRSTGQWDDLGPPNAAGTYSRVWAIAEDATYIYLGGDFLNWDNIANADYIVRYHKHDGTWSALGTGMNGTVEALVVGPDGTLYAGGGFTTAGGGAASKIASWNGAAWSALGAGMNDTVLALVIGLDGTLYAGGKFTTAGGGGANRIASWNGAAWSALGVGVDSWVLALAIGLDGTLYVGGQFTNAGGAGANYIASWDGTNWSPLGSGMNDFVRALAVDSRGVLYAGGKFTTAGGSTANRVADWNGTAWTTLDTGLNNECYALAIGPDNGLYAGGLFTTAGDTELADQVAMWTGGVWTHLDIDLPSTPTVYTILCGDPDPVVGNNFDLWLGFNTEGTGYFSGITTVTSDGTVEARPKIIFERSGGTSATIISVRNETTGKRLLFDYDLLDDERLTIDLTPGAFSVYSDHWGRRMDAIKSGSDEGAFTLQPGDNEVTCFVAEVGAPTVVAYMLWRTPFKSYD